MIGDHTFLCLGALVSVLYDEALVPLLQVLVLLTKVVQVRLHALTLAAQPATEGISHHIVNMTV